MFADYRLRVTRTRHVVYRPAKLTADALKSGYDRAYRDFYSWRNIALGTFSHDSVKHQAKHFFYAAGRKKFEPPLFVRP
jgi:hypothetical protein